MKKNKNPENPCNPAFWGPAAWTVIHSVSSHKRGKKVRKFVDLLPASLPCKACAQHLQRVYRAMPPPASCLGKYCFEVHQAVNERVGGKRKGRYSARKYAKPDSAYVRRSFRRVRRAIEACRPRSPAAQQLVRLAEELLH